MLDGVVQICVHLIFGGGGGGEGDSEVSLELTVRQCVQKLMVEREK